MPDDFVTDRNGNSVRTGDYVTDSGRRTKYPVVVENGRIEIKGVRSCVFHGGDEDLGEPIPVVMQARSFTGTYWSKCEPPASRMTPSANEGKDPDGTDEEEPTQA